MATIYRSFQDCLTYSLSNSFNGEGVSLKIPQTWLLHRKCIAEARDSDWGGGESPLVSFSFGIIRPISLSYQLSYTNDYKLWPNKKVIYCCPVWFFVYHISKYKITMNISLFFFYFRILKFWFWADASATHKGLPPFFLPKQKFYQNSCPSIYLTRGIGIVVFFCQ